MSKNYAGVEDLLSDESFLSWYFKTDIRAVQQWDEWIAANPQSRERVDQALDFLRSLQLEEEEMSSDQITLAESRLLEKIRAAEKGPAPVRKMTPRKWWMAAASVLVLAAGLYEGSQLLSPRPSLRTTYGEIKDNRLPDGTEVVVNADSRITWSTGWKDGKDREVWLTGEAYFHVTRTPQHSRFIVHTDHFDILVTGTRFNVVNRQDKANVMLKEGSVILHTTEGRELKMKPGDFVEYHPSKLEKKALRTDSILAWKEHKLLFNNTPIRDVAQIIREHYGIQVLLADPSVGDSTVFGIMANDNLDVLLQALQATNDFEVVRNGDSVIIRNHP
jgi:ferric-dicitrate binding protein FerR (iron transport regulator)